MMKSSANKNLQPQHKENTGYGEMPAARVGPAAARLIFMQVSSLVTDGVFVNKGEKSGLWSLFQFKIRHSG